MAADRWWLVADDWRLTADGWRLTTGGWLLVADGWRPVAGSRDPSPHPASALRQSWSSRSNRRLASGGPQEPAA
ncbi:phosphotransferase [Marichromatium purpuratum 984]|uniref:Phosphotransferase n=1 Tax=Marichromatium purpuratum 984 TaxID=765910 RepID=W0E2P6_MARPU|nr:phosphotransferase [Marichromatium purpuratum 984]